MFRISYTIIFLQFSTYLIATNGEYLGGPCAEAINEYINSILRTYPGIVLPPFNYNCMQDKDNYYDVMNRRDLGDIRLSQATQSHHAFSSAGLDRIMSQSGQGGEALRREQVSHQSGNKRFETMAAFSDNIGEPNKMNVKNTFETGLSHHNQFQSQAALTEAHLQNPNRLLNQRMDDRQNNLGIYSGVPGGPRPVESPMTRPMDDYQRKLAFIQNSISNQGVQENHISNRIGVADDIFYQKRGDHVGNQQILGGYSTYQEKMRLLQQNEMRKEQIRLQQENALKPLQYYQGGTQKKETVVSNQAANQIRELGMPNAMLGGMNGAPQIYQPYGGQNLGSKMYPDQAADGIEIYNTGDDRGYVKGGQKVLISNCPDGSDLCITIDT
ncbi:uncharacterized protein LOC123676942 [Harmonia axyridis]|uniref:uncharacterized protein LOC123676942 n=1 Tax=Harmonia axyridis TaxID=115357 RepID=UPI001E2765BF|nr:uncharacterized protein LOC123676942 [Harmonia axyridis]